MNVQSLPPKMAEQFAVRARNGEADLQLSTSCYIFYQGSNEICLVSIGTFPQGHIKKQTTAEIALRKFGKI